MASAGKGYPASCVGLEAVGVVSVYDIESGTEVAVYEGLEVHVAMLAQAGAPSTAHAITLMTQRSLQSKEAQIAGLVAERAAWQAQRQALLDERTAHEQQLSALADERDALTRCHIEDLVAFSAISRTLDDLQRYAADRDAEVNRLARWLQAIEQITPGWMAAAALHTTLTSPPVFSDAART